MNTPATTAPATTTAPAASNATDSATAAPNATTPNAAPNTTTPATTSPVAAQATTPQPPLRVTFLGPRGTFTEQALQDMIALGYLGGSEGRGVEAIPKESPRAALDAVRAGEADLACVALESSVDGPVSQTEDALTYGSPLQIYREVLVPIAFSILVRPGTRPEDIRTFTTHPVAHAQVRGWLRENLPDAAFLPASSNGAAAETVAQGGADAAAAPARAGEIFGLDELAAGVADVGNAYTRFVLVGPPGVPVERTGRDRTGIALTLKNRPASLLDALAELSTRGVDMFRISSRPLRGDVGKSAAGGGVVAGGGAAGAVSAEAGGVSGANAGGTGAAGGSVMGMYIFHIGVVGHIDDDAVAEALAGLYRSSESVRFMGSWPSAEGVRVPGAGSAVQAANAGANSGGGATDAGAAGGGAAERGVEGAVDGVSAADGRGEGAQSESFGNGFLAVDRHAGSAPPQYGESRAWLEGLRRGER